MIAALWKSHASRVVTTFLFLLGVTLFDLQSIVTQRDLLDIKFLSRSFIARTTWRTAQPQVAQPLPMLLTDPTLYQQPLKAHAASPLAAVARDNSSLQVGC